MKRALTRKKDLLLTGGYARLFRARFIRAYPPLLSFNKDVSRERLTKKGKENA
jgi:hypothetical protein